MIIIKKKYRLEQLIFSRVMKKELKQRSRLLTYDEDNSVRIKLDIKYLAKYFQITGKGTLE